MYVNTQDNSFNRQHTVIGIKNMYDIFKQTIKSNMYKF